MLIKLSWQNLNKLITQILLILQILITQISTKSSYLSLWWGKHGWQTYLFTNSILVMVSKYNLISRFSISTKNVLSSGKHSCYSPFHSKADLANTELEFWIKLWPQTSFLYLFLPIQWLKLFCRGKHRLNADLLIS